MVCQKLKLDLICEAVASYASGCVICKHLATADHRAISQ